MAKARKDHMGRVLRQGETLRKYDLMYIYTYSDPFTHKRKYIYSKDLLELRRKEKELQKDQLDGIDIYLAGRATLNFLFDRYITTKTDLKNSTYTNYLYVYNHFIREALGKQLVKDIKYSTVLHFYRYLVDDRGIQVNTLESVHGVLHPTLQMAVRDNIIRNNPSDNVMSEIKKKRGRNHGVRHALTLEQQRAFMDYIRGDVTYFRWVPLFTVMLGTGCRVGEIIGLRWKDIDLEKRMINVNHQISYYPRHDNSFKCEYAVSTPKTESGIRNVPMMEEVYQAFLDEKKRQREEGIFNTQEVDGMSGFIFCNRFGRLHNPASINREIKRIRTAYNAKEILDAEKEHRPAVYLPNFSCHIFRHTFCARFCENESNVKVIQEVMGHADIRTTLDIYAEVADSRKTQAIDELSRNMHIF